MEHIFLSLSVAVGQALRRIRDRKKRKYDQSISTEPGWYLSPLSLLSIGMQAGIPFIIASHNGCRSTSTKSSGNTHFPFTCRPFFTLFASYSSSLYSWPISHSLNMSLWMVIFHIFTYLVTRNCPEIVLKMLVRIFVWAAEIDIWRKVSDA